MGLLTHSGLTTVFSAWTYVSILTLTIVAVLSLYQMLMEEARLSKEGDLTEIRRDLLFLLKYKHITWPFLVLSLVAAVGYFSRIFSVFFSLQMVYAAVIILAMESIFHSLFRFWPRFLKESALRQDAFVAVIVVASLLLSLFVVGAADVILISIVFAGFILVGGIGLAFVVDKTASSLSHLPTARNRVSVSIVFIALILLAVWLWYTGDFVGYISGTGTGISGSNIIAGLNTEYQSLLSGVNISFLSVVLALIFTVVYFASVKLGRSRTSGANNALFILISVPTAGFVFLYLAILADGDWAASVGGIGTAYSYAIQLVPSIALFAVGYSQILIEIPRKTSRILMTQENRFLAALTWLIIFSALAEFLSWSVYGQPGTFVFEVDVVQWFGIPIGIVLLVFRYVRKR